MHISQIESEKTANFVVFSFRQPKVIFFHHFFCKIKAFLCFTLTFTILLSRLLFSRLRINLRSQIKEIAYNIYSLVEESPWNSFALDRFVNYSLPIANVAQMIIVKLEPSIIFLTVEISPIVPTIVLHQTSQNENRSLAWAIG